MRVIAGELGGRRLVAPRGSAVRPTSDRVRGAIANMLDVLVGLDGARVADVCCGTGALGIETLSRGAAHVEFVDRNRRSLDATRTNLEGVGLRVPRFAAGKDPVAADGAARISLSAADAVDWAATVGPERFDVVMIDPPYAWDGWDRFLAAVGARTALVMAESDRELTHLAWQVVKVRRYGGTVVTMLSAPDLEGGR